MLYLPFPVAILPHVVFTSWQGMEHDDANPWSQGCHLVLSIPATYWWSGSSVCQFWLVHAWACACHTPWNCDVSGAVPESGGIPYCMAPALF